MSYYALPILHGDRLMGRIDSKIDRKRQRYDIHNIYLESGIDHSPPLRAAIADSIAGLARFLDASTVEYADA